MNVACEVGPTWQFILLYNIEQQSTGLGSIIPTAALISYLVGRLFKAYSDQYLLINKGRRSYIFRVLGWGRLYLSYRSLFLWYWLLSQGCGWAFTTASKLTRHMNKHTGERRWECPIEGCGKAFMRAEHLKGHVVTHSGARPFLCPVEGEKTQTG